MDLLRDIPRAEGAGMKHLTTRWEKTRRKRNNEWKYKVRFVGRECRWQEFQEDLFAPGVSYCIERIVDILSLKQAPELDDVVVEPPEEYLSRLRTAGMSTDIWWKLQKAIAGSTPSWSTMGRSFHVCVGGKVGFHEVRERTAVLLESRPSSRDGGAHG